MRVNGEAFFWMNAWVDFLALLLAARMASLRLSLRRGFLAALLGAAYALASYGLWPALRAVPGLMLGALLMTFAAFGRQAAGWPWVMAGSFALSGLNGFLWRQGVPPGGVMICCGAAALLVIFLHDRIRLPRAGIVRLTVAYDGGSVTLPALRDSGNLLCDPVTGLPVIVASEAALKPLMPDDLDICGLSALPPGFRLLCADTAAGRRMLMCFHPPRVVLFSGGRRRHIDAVIALSPEPIGRALVPERFFQQKEGSTHASL